MTSMAQLIDQAVQEELDKVEVGRVALASIIDFDVPGIRSASILNKTILLHCFSNDWRPAYRAIRSETGNRPSRQSIFPNGANGNGGQVTLDFAYGDCEIALIFYTKDVTRFIKPGANCQRRPMMYEIVCE